MTQWLLAAEADKIQDFLFGSSRLAQVAGGSAFLARFCREMPRYLQPPPAKRIISAGGSFRLLFSSRVEAVAAGQFLAEAYRRAIDGSLTVAQPQELENGSYRDTSAATEEALRKAKRHRHGAGAVAHLPQVALCASCGRFPADDHFSPFPPERANYLCFSCRTKARERRQFRSAREEQLFLDRFLGILSDETGGLVRAPQPGDRPDEWTRQLAREAEDIAAFDPKNYVAYVVADGNGMGALFQQCETPEDTMRLSEALDGAMWNAFSKTAAKLYRGLWIDEADRRVPALPLIVGGDDLFALIAAPSSLDFGRRLCDEFEDSMRASGHNATLSVAIVICKAAYPYHLAHRHGERLLEHAKRLAKGNLPAASVVDFEVVLGADWEPPELGASDRTILPTARPYWAGRGGDPKAALPIQALLEHRKNLKDLPGKRKAELRHLFRESPESGDWESRRKGLMDRIAALGGPEEALRQAQSELGGKAAEGADWWREIKRKQPFRGHGLPDLLEAWDFANFFETPLEHDPREAE